MAMKKEYDIIVVGGGMAGVMAAISAGRVGANVLLIEQYGSLGGMLTIAGVGPMMTFHAGSKQVIKGITAELVDRLVKEGASPGHIFDTIGYCNTVTPFDVEAMKWILDEMTAEANVDVLFHTMLAQVKTENSRISSIIVCNKAGLSELSALVYIDATGDGDLFAGAGLEFTKGRTTDSRCQPLSTMCVMDGVDVEKIKDYIRANPADFPVLKDNILQIDKSQRLSISGFRSIVQKAKKAQMFDIPCDELLMFEMNQPARMIINVSRVQSVDPTDPYQLSKAESQGRKQVHQIASLLKASVPGFEDSSLIYSGPNIGVRNSRQFKGIYTLCRQDLYEFKKFYDAIACSAYPVDIHPLADEKFENESEHFKSEDFYTIPYRCLVSEKIDNLIIAGRCISATFEAQAGIRTTPTVGAIGNAAGAAAAIAAMKKIETYQVPYHALREILLAQSAFLG
jgi:hypothetical protein